MDDLNQPGDPGNLRWHGPLDSGGEGPPLPPGFAPLRLVLYPGGCAVALTRPDMVMGRHSSVDVRLHLPDVSRRHCRFVFAEGNWQVFDLNSLNGVLVNDQVVDQAVLHQGDRIRVGSYTFEVDLTDQAGADPLLPNGLKTLGHIADLLPKVPEQPQRQAS